MKNKAIVSLADSNYFELLNELIESIKRFEQTMSDVSEESKTKFYSENFKTLLGSHI